MTVNDAGDYRFRDASFRSRRSFFFRTLTQKKGETSTKRDAKTGPTFVSVLPSCRTLIHLCISSIGAHGSKSVRCPLCFCHARNHHGQGKPHLNSAQHKTFLGGKVNSTKTVKRGRAGLNIGEGPILAGFHLRRPFQPDKQASFLVVFILPSQKTLTSKSFDTISSSSHVRLSSEIV